LSNITTFKNIAQETALNKNAEANIGVAGCGQLGISETDADLDPYL
jgi:hypothetical protein